MSNQNQGITAMEGVQLGTALLAALADLLHHFPDNTVAFKVGKVLQEVNAVGGVVAPVVVGTIEAATGSPEAPPAAPPAP